MEIIYKQSSHNQSNSIRPKHINPNPGSGMIVSDVKGLEASRSDVPRLYPGLRDTKDSQDTQDNGEDYSWPVCMQIILTVGGEALGITGDCCLVSWLIRMK